MNIGGLELELGVTEDEGRAPDDLGETSAFDGDDVVGFEVI